MHKGLRLTETWMQRALWLVAIVFAAFLIGLGGKIVDNLRGLAPPPTAAEFIDPASEAVLKDAVRRAGALRASSGDALAQARQKHAVAAADTRSARQAFDNWIATRQATVRPDQDAELVERTRALDGLVARERAALGAMQEQQQVSLDASQAEQRALASYRELYVPARKQAEQAGRAAELKVFLYRLGLTLPLLLVAGWLFRHKRNGTYWPFAWGFIFFALYAFFFELVPYLPSYGGYVRYGVGIVLTVLVGHYAILWLQAWLARQKVAETLPDMQRRSTMRYDATLGRIAKGVCPSCERPTNYQDPNLAHCPHCGIGLFDHCRACHTRKNAFTRFCYSCGTPANISLAD